MQQPLSLVRHTEVQHNFVMLLLIVVAVQLMQQQMLTVSGKPFEGHVVVAAPDAAHQRSHNEINMRLHKRHSDFRTLYNTKIRKSIESEWLNPCRGASHHRSTTNRTTTTRPSHRRRIPARRKRVLRRLKGRLNNEYRTIVPEHGTLRQEIAKFARYDYKCLPRLMGKSKLSLRRFYRDLQYYTAYFAYFERAQMHWDRECLQYEGAQSKELHSFTQHSRNILCEIEMAINETSPHTKIPRLSRTVVETRMDFNTSVPEVLHKIEESHRQTHAKRRHRLQNAQQQRSANEIEAAVVEAVVAEVNRMDLLYLKHYYLKYLRQALKLLRTVTQKQMTKPM